MLSPEVMDPPSIGQVVWVDPERMSGAPCFTGTRVPIQALFDYIEDGDTVNEFLESFPGVTRQQVAGALYFGKERLIKEQKEP